MQPAQINCVFMIYVCSRGDTCHPFLILLCVLTKTIDEVEIPTNPNPGGRGPDPSESGYLWIQIQDMRPPAFDSKQISQSQDMVSSRGTTPADKRRLGASMRHDNLCKKKFFVVDFCPA